jgi:hypothetical protein
MSSILEIYTSYAQLLDGVLALTRDDLEEQPEWDAVADHYAALHREAALLPAVASYLNELDDTERSRLLALILDIQGKQDKVQETIRHYRDQTQRELKSRQNRDKLSDLYGNQEDHDL